MSFHSQDSKQIDRRWLREHYAELILFAFAISLLFIELGIGEFEDWDESHIVYRAQIIERFGAWLDQSHYSLGGLYSSSHPPLGVWLMVASRAIFGTSELATRLPSALCGLLACCGMFALLRRWRSDSLALLLSAAFTACSIFLWYSRHAQLDSLLLATSIWSLALFCAAVDRSSNRLASLAGLCFGIALLSKFGWALYILPYAIGYYYLQSTDRGILWRFLLIGGTVGASWYTYMTFTNDDFVRSVFGWVIGLSAVKNYEPGEKSAIYYFNQLILACPFIVISICSFFERKGWTRPKMLSLGWLVLTMVVLQFAATKFPHFALVLLPPAFLLSAQTLEKIERFSWWHRLLLGLAVVWSLSTQLRLLVRGAHVDLMLPNPGVFAPLALGLVLLVLLQLRRRSRDEVYLTALAGLIVIVAATRVIGYPRDLFDDGAKRIARTLSHRSDIHKLVVVHSGLPFDSITPRLAYYTKGWTAGWQHGKESVKLGWRDSALAVALTNITDNGSAVVLERERDRFAPPILTDIPNYFEIISQLQTRYTHRDSLRSYDLFY